MALPSINTCLLSASRKEEKNMLERYILTLGSINKLIITVMLNIILVIIPNSAYPSEISVQDQDMITDNIIQKSEVEIKTNVATVGLNTLEEAIQGRINLVPTEPFDGKVKYFTVLGTLKHINSVTNIVINTQELKSRIRDLDADNERIQTLSEVEVVKIMQLIKDINLPSPLNEAYKRLIDKNTSVNEKKELLGKFFVEYLPDNLRRVGLYLISERIEVYGPNYNIKNSISSNEWSDTNITIVKKINASHNLYKGKANFILYEKNLKLNFGLGSRVTLPKELAGEGILFGGLEANKEYDITLYHRGDGLWLPIDNRQSKFPSKNEK